MTAPSGLQLEVFPDVGRALVATRDFAIGDLILSETPFFQVPTTLLQKSALNKQLADVIAKVAEEFPDTGVPVSVQANLLADYVALSSRKRDELVNSFASDTTEDHILARFTSKVASAVHESITELQSFSTNELQKLLLVMIINAAEYVQRNESFVGLYKWGSKLAHSCSPKSVLMITEKQMSHYALQPIKAGDIVTTNYIIRDDIRACWTTPLRRRKLLDTKSFLCKCERCTAPDLNRTTKCPKCSQPTATPSDPNHTQTETWTCSNCSSIFTTDEMPTRMEQQLQTSVIEATAVFDTGLPTPQSFQKAMAKMDVVHKMATTVLGSEHWLSNWPKPFIANKLSRTDMEAAARLMIEWVEWSERGILPFYPNIHVRHVLSSGKYCAKSMVEDRFYGAVVKCRPWCKAELLGHPQMVAIAFAALKEAERKAFGEKA
ncbi:hypothetical protein HK097_007395 [Rhizophlyctis rosea]|uniref:SET domain-containing protein n=1 Tax=Rhizophlyctis rosea TaxID=64517 RepID=A0AAD5X8N7_9FUNG|nr:hypothetical protein HK097_007395 [Rhizophlyctis rosea]